MIRCLVNDLAEPIELVAGNADRDVREGDRHRPALAQADQRPVAPDRVLGAAFRHGDLFSVSACDEVLARR
jgi:hypothetical protein